MTDRVPEPLYHPEYPRKIVMEMERPEEADPDECEALVSRWYDEECERGFAFLQDLWNDRVGYGFDAESYRNTIMGLPMARYPRWEIDMLGQYWRARRTMRARHAAELETLQQGWTRKSGRLAG